MADDKVTHVRRQGRIVGYKGSESAKGAKYDAIAEKQEREKYRKANGASGIAGARKAATPEFKSKEDAYIAEWKKRRAAEAAKKEGQRKAAAEIDKSKE